MKSLGRLVLMGLLLAACQDGELPTTVVLDEPAFQIFDGTHPQGDSRFFFLPPIVSEPSFSGTFDPSLEPVVDIVELPSERLLVTYTTTSGWGSERVRVEQEHERYAVYASSRDANLDLSLRYRVRVWLEGVALGHADVHVVSSAEELSTVDSSQYVGLVNGETLSIHFRIETVASPPPAPAEPLFSSVTTGGHYACALNTEGEAYCWGRNDRGQLGNGTTIASGPQRAADGMRFASLHAAGPGGAHTCGVTADRDLFCWGTNTSGELGNGTTASSTVPVQITSGGIVAAMSLGANHSCGLEFGGEAYCWGARGLGDGTRAGSTVPVRVAAGGVPFTSIAGGSSHTCALAPDGAAYCWGALGRGDLGSGLGGEDGRPSSSVPVLVQGGIQFESVSAGWNHSCGVTSAGALYCWGSNEHGQLGNGTTEPTGAPTRVASGGVSFASVSAGDNFTCAVTADGGAYCWGSNARGLGNSATTSSPVPVAVQSEGLHFVSIDAANVHACAVTDGGEIHCWGGAPGNGTTEDSRLPIKVVIP